MLGGGGGVETASATFRKLDHTIVQVFILQPRVNINMSKERAFLVDDALCRSRYIWASSWEEAEQICREENFELVGEYICTEMWFDMPTWMEEAAHDDDTNSDVH